MVSVEHFIIQLKTKFSHMYELKNNYKTSMLPLCLVKHSGLVRKFKCMIRFTVRFCRLNNTIRSFQRFFATHLRAI